MGRHVSIQGIEDYEMALQMWDTQVAAAAWVLGKKRVACEDMRGVRIGKDKATEAGVFAWKDFKGENLIGV